MCALQNVYVWRAIPQVRQQQDIADLVSLLTAEDFVEVG